MLGYVNFGYLIFVSYYVFFNSLRVTSFISSRPNTFCTYRLRSAISGLGKEKGGPVNQWKRSEGMPIYNGDSDRNTLRRYSEGPDLIFVGSLTC